MNQTLENYKKFNSGPNCGLFDPAHKIFWRVLPLLVVRHCSKLSSYANLRKTNEPNLRKCQKKTNFGSGFGPFLPKAGPKKFFHVFYLNCMSSYAIRSDLRSGTGVDASCFSIKADLANLKSYIDDWDIEKLKTIRIDLSKLSNVIKMTLLKNTVYDELVKNVYVNHIIDFSDLVKKAAHGTKNENSETRINMLLTIPQIYPYERF